MGTKEKLDTYSTRLKYAMKFRGISQSELGRRIGASKQMIHNLCSRDVRKSGFTFEIAEALGMSAVWLASGHGEMFLEDDPAYVFMQEQKQIPLLEWSEITSWLSKNHTTKSNKKRKCIASDLDLSAQAFAVITQDKSMYPRIDKNSVLIVDPIKAATDQSLVIAWIAKYNEIYFRQLIITEEQRLLQPFNQELFKSMPLETDDKIIGVVCEARWRC